VLQLDTDKTFLELIGLQVEVEDPVTMLLQLEEMVAEVVEAQL
jgi:hypothetical protein